MVTIYQMKPKNNSFLILFEPKNPTKNINPKNP